MSTSSLYSTTTRLARKHSRVSLLAAGAATAGLLGGACAIAGATPWNQATDHVAKTVHNGSLTSSGTRTSALDMLGVGVPDSLPAGHHTIGGNASRAQLTAAQGSGAAKIATAPVKTVVQAPAKAAAPAKIVAPAKAAAPAKIVAPAKAAAPVKIVAPAKAAAPVKAVAPAKAAAPVRTVAHAKAAAPARFARAVRHQALRHRAAQRANLRPSRPYLVYDSVTANSIPSGQPAAVYANGSYAASASQVAGHHSVLWIDTNGSDTAANVLDVEPGDATPAGAAQWVEARLNSHPHSEAIVYTMRSDWQAVKDNVGGLPSWMQPHVKYWIADPTGYPHVVPGSSATQWYWGKSYDISTANPNFEH